MRLHRLLFVCAFVSSALGVAPASAAITHTSSNLNLRGGPGTHHAVKVIIPSGAPIDIHSCGDTWCYVAWAGHIGYVDHRYLVHHVTEEVAPLVVHVHKHGLINF
jgi:uncharacterized protein YraI